MNAQEVKLILQRYRSGESTDAENRLVEAWYQRLINTGEWEWGEGEKEALENTIKEQLLRRIEPGPAAHRVHFLKTSWFRYAAAVALVAGVGAIGYEILKPVQNDGPIVANDNKHLQKDIAPGGDKAVLTLADGSKIVLDNAENGNLAQQGNTKIIKLTNGQLAYDAAGVIGGGHHPELNGSRHPKLDLGSTLYNTISTPRGGQYQIVLPDGTKVWLNAASSIKFPTVFTGSSRDVEVTGEIYMEIAKNPKQAFVVKANGTEIQVLGTSFDINAYSDEEVVKTTLIDGSVKVFKGSDMILLKPGQQAAVGLGNIKVQPADMDQTLAWKNGSFYFNRTDIQSVMRQLSRWYDVEIAYEHGIPSVKVSGEMQRSLNLSQVLEILEKIGVHYSIEGKKLIVLP